ncbi:MAG TPA: hypothetical protein DCG49_05870 [Ruminococcus sp.]|nr:hypothetical protein [Ruminococcus sp.]
MKINYEQYRYSETRTVNIKMFTPDDENTDRYVIVLHGFADSMESAVIHALAVNLSRCNTAVLAFNYAGHGNDEQDALFSMETCLRDFKHVTEFAIQRWPGAVWGGVFATGFGGYLVLNALDIIPESVNIVLHSPAVYMSDVFERIVNETDGRMDAYADKGFVTLGFPHKLNVPYLFYQELRAHNTFLTRFDREMLLINGTKDEIVLRQDVSVFCLCNSQIKHCEIEGAGHRMQTPSEISELMKHSCPHLLKNMSLRNLPDKNDCVYEADEDQHVCASCMYWGTERGYNCTAYGDYAIFCHDSICLHPEQYKKAVRSRFGCPNWTKACETCAAEFNYKSWNDGWD